jgi:sucrose-6-phosphate hydrolase SacC (GH32 family)
MEFLAHLDEIFDIVRAFIDIETTWEHRVGLEENKESSKVTVCVGKVSGQQLVVQRVNGKCNFSENFDDSRVAILGCTEEQVEVVVVG